MKEYEQSARETIGLKRKPVDAAKETAVKGSRSGPFISRLVSLQASSGRRLGLRLKLCVLTKFKQTVLVFYPRVFVDRFVSFTRVAGKSGLWKKMNRGHID